MTEFRSSPHASSRRGSPVAWGKKALKGLALLAGLFFFVSYLFTQAGYFLYRVDPLPSKDEPVLAILLMGEVVPRSQQAIRLLTAGYVAQVFFFSCEDSELERKGLVDNDAILSQKLLLQAGISASRFTLIEHTRARSSLDEAQLALAWLKKHAPQSRSLLLITSWYHSRRAAWIFERVFAGSGITIRVSPAPSASPAPAKWWLSEADFLHVFNEYLKLSYYAFHHVIALY